MKENKLRDLINCGQFSVNISKPGITKGQQWSVFGLHKNLEHRPILL